MTRRKMLSFLLGLGAACAGFVPSLQARFEQENVRLLKLQAEQLRLYRELHDQVLEAVKRAHEQRMVEMTFILETEERERLIRALPRVMNEMTGRKVFSTSS